VTSRRRRALARAALAVGTTLLALVGAELVVRALGVTPSRYPSTWHLESPDKRFGLDLYPDDARHYFPLDLRDAATLAAMRAHGLPRLEERAARAPFGVPGVYGAKLCRGASIPPRDPARPRVVVIGDSFTEGQGVREEDTFVARLGRRMPDAEVLNCGRRGYDFPELAMWFEQHLALEPDVVVYAMVLNDPQQSERFHARQEYLDDWIVDRRRMASADAPPAWEPRLWSIARERVEARRVGDATTSWYREMVGAPNADGWAATLEHIEHMDAAMRARGGRLLVLLWPLLVELDGGYPFEATHRTIADALRARHVAFHDALPAFRGRIAETLWVHPADRHPNERAQRLFAAEVAPAVRAALDEARR
jgi:lysophospholipase L1-like esterase